VLGCKVFEGIWELYHHIKTHVKGRCKSTDLFKVCNMTTEMLRRLAPPILGFIPHEHVERPQ
jgi:hypothetical protein